jgi:hypothetical protein
MTRHVAGLSAGDRLRHFRGTAGPGRLYPSAAAIIFCTADRRGPLRSGDWTGAPGFRCRGGYRVELSDPTQEIDHHNG